MVVFESFFSSIFFKFNVLPYFAKIMEHKEYLKEENKVKNTSIHSLTNSHNNIYESIKTNSSNNDNNNQSCVDKKFSDRLSSFERRCSSWLRLLMALRRSLLRIDKASLLETFGSLKIRNFGYTPNCLQLLRKSMSNFSFFFLHSSHSYLRKSLTVKFTYFRVISL